MKHLLLLLSLLPALAAGALEVPAIFGDHMVLQRGIPVRVWGKTEPGSTVAVSVAGEHAETRTAPDGRWRVELPPPETPGGPHVMTVKSGDKALAFKDVMIGDVYLCAGQSNMELLLKDSENGKAEVAASNYPDIRLFRVQRVAAYERTGELYPKPWRPCSPATSGWFSAVAYFFGREVHRELGIPVGLIDASWGGVSISPYLPRERLNSDPDFAPILERFTRSRAHMTPEETAAYETKLKDWEKAYASDPSLKRPEPPWGRSQFHPGTLYDGMIDPLAPFGLRGVLWYQGEANTVRARQYRKLLPLLIESWRARWGQPDLPFLIVQLPNYRNQPGSQPPPEFCWAELRETQAMALKVPRTALAVTIDLGEAENIHPKNKQEVGRRLALAAFGLIYGKPGLFSGPVFRNAEFRDGKAELAFDCAEGLVVQNPPLHNFEIAGTDRRFHPADAEVRGDTVVVSSPEVPSPVAVRYCWENNPEQCNLWNRAGLPAMPFRTDNWPGVTDDRK